MKKQRVSISDIALGVFLGLVYFTLFSIFLSFCTVAVTGAGILSLSGH